MGKTSGEICPHTWKQITVRLCISPVLNLSVYEAYMGVSAASGKMLYLLLSTLKS